MKNKKEIWFEKRWYGYCPVSTEGFLLSLGYIASLWYWFQYADMNSNSGSDTLIAFAPIFIIISVAYVFVCRAKS